MAVAVKSKTNIGAPFLDLRFLVNSQQSCSVDFAEAGSFPVHIDHLKSHMSGLITLFKRKNEGFT